MDLAGNPMKACNDAPECRSYVDSLYQLGIECDDLQEKEKTYGSPPQRLSAYCPHACSGSPCIQGETLGKASLACRCECLIGVRGDNSEIVECLDDEKRASGTYGDRCARYAGRNRAYCKIDKGVSNGGRVTMTTE